METLSKQSSLNDKGSKGEQTLGRVENKENLWPLPRRLASVAFVQDTTTAGAHGKDKPGDGLTSRYVSKTRLQSASRVPRAIGDAKNTTGPAPWPLPPRINSMGEREFPIFADVTPSSTMIPPQTELEKKITPPSAVEGGRISYAIFQKIAELYPASPKSAVVDGFSLEKPSAASEGLVVREKEESSDSASSASVPSFQGFLQNAAVTYESPAQEAASFRNEVASRRQSLDVDNARLQTGLSSCTDRSAHCVPLNPLPVGEAHSSAALPKSTATDGDDANLSDSLWPSDDDEENARNVPQERFRELADPNAGATHESPTQEAASFRNNVVPRRQSVDLAEAHLGRNLSLASGKGTQSVSLGPLPAADHSDALHKSTDTDEDENNLSDTLWPSDDDGEGIQDAPLETIGDHADPYDLASYLFSPVHGGGMEGFKDACDKKEPAAPYAVEATAAQNVDEKPQKDHVQVNPKPLRRPIGSRRESFVSISRFSGQRQPEPKPSTTMVDSAIESGEAKNHKRLTQTALPQPHNAATTQSERGSRNSNETIGGGGSAPSVQRVALDAGIKRTARGETGSILSVNDASVAAALIAYREKVGIEPRGYMSTNLPEYSSDDGDTMLQTPIGQGPETLDTSSRATTRVSRTGDMDSDETRSPGDAWDSSSYGTPNPTWEWNGDDDEESAVVNAAFNGDSENSLSTRMGFGLRKARKGILGHRDTADVPEAGRTDFVVDGTMADVVELVCQVCRQDLDLRAMVRVTGDKLRVESKPGAPSESTFCASVTFEQLKKKVPEQCRVRVKASRADRGKTEFATLWAFYTSLVMQVEMIQEDAYLSRR